MTRVKSPGQAVQPTHGDVTAQIGSLPCGPAETPSGTGTTDSETDRVEVNVATRDDAAMSGADLHLTLPRPRSDRRLLMVGLANPLDDVEANTSLSLLVNTGVAVALDRFAERFPGVNRNAAYRVLEWAGTSLLEIEKAVYLHEAGHARGVSKAGGHPEIDMGFMSGMTSYDFDKGRWPNPLVMADISGAGMTQVSLNARANYVQWAMNGDAYYQEAAAYLFESLHTALYAGRTLWLGDKAPAYDDVRAYVDEMNRAGASLTRGQVFAVALATALANAPSLWKATEGQWRFLVDGERRGASLPTFKLGGTTLTWPHFYTALSGAGIFAGGTFLINPDKALPASVDLIARVDDWSAAGVKVQLHGLSLAQEEKAGVSLSISPYFGGSIDKKGGFGGVVGAEVLARRGNAALSIGVGVHDRDLFGAATGSASSGVSFGVKLGWSF